MSQLAYITRFQFTDFLGSSIIRYGAESSEGFSGSDMAKATMTRRQVQLATMTNSSMASPTANPVTRKGHAHRLRGRISSILNP